MSNTDTSHEATVTIVANGSFSQILRLCEAVEDHCDRSGLQVVISLAGEKILGSLPSTGQVVVPGMISELLADSADETMRYLPRARNCLLRAQINTTNQLTSKSRGNLLELTNFGNKCLEVVIARLAEYGLTLAD